MRFAFTDEQLELRDGLVSFLEAECPPARVRAAWGSAEGRSGLWDALIEMGVVGITAPEEAGGLGGDEVDLVLLLEEAGRHALPEPLVETTAVAIPLLAEAGDPRAGTLATGGRGAAAVSPRDELAPWADSTDVVVLFDAGGVHVVDRDRVVLEPRASVDGARRLAWVDATLGDDTRVGDADAAELAFDRGALGTAAVLIGLARWMLDIAIAYACERVQFGAPIGSFQAVKHQLADARVAREFAAPLVYRASASLTARDPDRSVHVSMAKARAAEAASRAARVALQVHGAIGYTTEHDLHLWMKRTWALARSWGTTAWHRDRVARAVMAGRVVH